MSSFQRLARDRGGNFGIMTAVLLPVLLGTAGFAIDMSNAMQVKSSIQGIADAAALAAASAMAQKDYTKAQAEKLAKDYLVSQLLADGIADVDNAAEKAAIEARIRAATTATAKETVVKGSNKNFTVTLDTLYAMNLNPITSILAGKSLDIGVNAVASTGSVGSDTRTGMSMYLALDRSGSMSFKTTTKNTKQTSCINYTAENWWRKDYKWYEKDYLPPSNPCYIRKIDALKTAATALFTSLNKADTSLTSANPTSTLVRVGAVSYTDETQKTSSMAWGTTTAADYVQKLPSIPTGGTDATGAMKAAFDALKKAEPTEGKAHGDKENDTFNRYIVLMTDGEMTGSSAEWKPSLDKKVREQCDEAKKDGIMIFTVAFMAPENGKSLLSYCATSTDYYYSPDNMSALVAAFGEIAEKAAKKSVRLTH